MRIIQNSNIIILPLRQIKTHRKYLWERIEDEKSKWQCWSSYDRHVYIQTLFFAIILVDVATKTKNQIKLQVYEYSGSVSKTLYWIVTALLSMYFEVLCYLYILIARPKIYDFSFRTNGAKRTFDLILFIFNANCNFNLFSVQIVFSIYFTVY